MFEFATPFTDAALGLAGSAASAIPFDFMSSIAPTITTLPTDALAGITGTLAEEGKDVATSLMPNLTAAGAPTVANAAAQFGGSTASVAPTIANSWAQFGTDGSNFGGGLASSMYPTGGRDFVGGIKGYGSDAMKLVKDNSDIIKAGGSVFGGLAQYNSSKAYSKSAKRQADLAEASYNRNIARQDKSDASLQAASDRVFGA